MQDLGNLVQLGDELYTKGEVFVKCSLTFSEGADRGSARFSLPAEHVRHGR